MASSTNLFFWLHLVLLRICLVLFKLNLLLLGRRFGFILGRCGEVPGHHKIQIGFLRSVPEKSNHLRLSHTIDTDLVDFQQSVTRFERTFLDGGS